MANEFIIRKGFKSLQDSELTGSLNLSGNIVAAGTVQAEFASNTSTAISGAFDSVSSSLASELLKNTTDTLTGDLTVTGTLTAQDLHVQEVTSSIVYSSGSNVFGSLDSHSHDFTGTINISRGGDRKVSFTDTRGGKVWTIEHDTNKIYLWNATDSEAPITFKNTGDVIMNAGSVGIGTDSPNAPLAVVGTGAGSIGTINIKGSNAHLGFTSGSGTFRSWVGHFDTLGHGSEADLNIKTGYGTTGNIRFTADGDTTAAQMYLQGSSGHLGIGTTDPGSRRLSVHKNTAITAGFNDISEFLDTTLGVGGSVSLNVGRENATRNLGKMAFKYAGDNSTSNALNFGFYDADNLMTILANGNVGISTTSPSHRLEIKGISTALTSDTNMRFFIDRSSASYLGSIIFTTGGASVSNGWAEIGQTDANGDLYFKANASAASYDTRMIIKGSNGRVGIGTTSPSGDLEISGSGNSNRTITFNPSFNDDISISSMGVDGSGYNAVTIGQANSQNNSGVFRFKYTGAGSTNNYVGLGFYANDDKLVITPAGNVGIGTTSPGAKLTSYIGSASISGTNDGLRLQVVGYNDTARNTIAWHQDSPNLNLGRFGLEWNLSDSQMVFVWRDVYNGAVGTTELMRLTGGGNLGIGTTSPNAILHAGSTGTNAYSSTITKGSNMKGIVTTVASNTDDMVGIYFGTGTTTEGTHWSGITGARSDNASHWGTQLNFYTHNNDVANLNDATQKMVIMGDGKVGIGTTSPGYPLHLSSTSLYQAAIKSTGAQYLLIGSENASTAGIILDGDSNGDGAGGDYSYIVHENTGELKIVQDSPSGTNSLSFGTAGTENRVTIDGNGNVGINSTSPDYPLDVQGQIANRKGLLSAYGVYTAGGTYTNQWQKVFEISYPNVFAFAAMKMLVSLAGDTSNVNMNAEVHINYKFQNNNGRINVNIVNFGELPLTTDDFEVYRDGTNTKLVFYHRVTRNYARPYYTLLNNSDSSMTWSNTVVGASLSGEANDSFTEKNIANTINARPDTSHVGIGTTVPGAKLTVANTATGDTRNLLLTNLNDTDGDSASLGFSMLANNTYVKGGIMFERTLNAGRGNLYLMTNSATDGTNVSKSDARLTVQHDGKIGINTTQPSHTLEVNGNVQTGQSLNVSGYAHLGQTNSGAMTILGHNARVDTSTNNRVTATNSSWPASFIKMYYTQGISFHTTDTNQTAGTVLLDGTGANSLERMRVTDDGITFNGDTAAANALDDYEEGTWTPVLTASSSAPTVGYAYRSGDYTKIGNIVFCRFGFKVNSISGGSGTVRITGLPYTHSSQGAYQEPNISVQAGALSTADYAYRTRMFVANSNTYLEGRIVNNSDTAWNISEITSTSWIIAQFFYHVN